MKTKEFLESNKKHIIDLTIFLVILGLFSYSYYSLGNGTAKYIKTQKQIAATNLAYTQNDQIIKDFNKSNIQKTDLTAALPSQKTIINWIEQTEEIASLANVSQTISFTNGELTKDNIVVAQPTNSNGAPVINGEIEIKGTYNNMLSYINMLHTSYYYVRINSLDFSAVKAVQQSSNSLSATPTPTVSSGPQGPVSLSMNFDLFVKDTSPTIK